MGYYRALVAVRHPSPPRTYATTALILLAILLLTHNPAARPNNTAYACNPVSVTAERPPF
jgi:hypothetical protein